MHMLEAKLQIDDMGRQLEDLNVPYRVALFYIGCILKLKLLYQVQYIPHCQFFD
jgi:hypothetical protein